MAALVVVRGRGGRGGGVPHAQAAGQGGAERGVRSSAFFLDIPACWRWSTWHRRVERQPEANAAGASSITSGSRGDVRSGRGRRCCIGCDSNCNLELVPVTLALAPAQTELFERNAISTKVTLQVPTAVDFAPLFLRA